MIEGEINITIDCNKRNGDALCGWLEWLYY